MKLSTRRPGLLAFSVIAIAAVGCSGTPDPDRVATIASAITIDTSATYTLVGVQSGKCVDVPNGSTSTGVQLDIATCVASTRQQFKLEAQGNGYRIRNVGSNLCMDVSGASTANGAAVIQWTCSTGTNQQWSFTDTSGAEKVTDLHAGKVLDVTGTATADGTKLEQWTWNSGSNQLFRLVAQSSPDAGTADGGAVKSAGCGATSRPTNNTYTINVTYNGTTKSRTFILRSPDNFDTNHPYRAIIAYHWLGGTADQVANGGGFTSKPFYGLWDLANGSTIFVAPQGIDPVNGWADTGGPGDPHDGPINKASQGGQDIAFTRAIVAWLESNLCVDTSRIFAEGFSMGGAMSYADACAMGDVFRAVAVHSGGPMAGCVYGHNKPVAYFMTHGLQDGVCPYGAYPGYGVPELADFATVNGCATPNPAQLPTGLPSPSGAQGTHGCIDFQGCKPGSPARACIFVGPHTPSSPDSGPSNWIPGETWKFLSQF
jgi:polyhydroxybutyrate depolymerase